MYLLDKNMINIYNKIIKILSQNLEDYENSNQNIKTKAFKNIVKSINSVMLKQKNAIYEYKFYVKPYSDNDTSYSLAVCMDRHKIIMFKYYYFHKYLKQRRLKYIASIICHELRHAIDLDIAVKSLSSSLQTKYFKCTSDEMIGYSEDDLDFNPFEMRAWMTEVLIELYQFKKPPKGTKFYEWIEFSNSYKEYILRITKNKDKIMRKIYTIIYKYYDSIGIKIENGVFV